MKTLELTNLSIQDKLVAADITSQCYPIRTGHIVFDYGTDKVISYHYPDGYLTDMTPLESIRKVLEEAVEKPVSKEDTFYVQF